MLTRDPSILQDDDEADARADAEAMADYEAGRFVDHETVRAWILSWRTPDLLPRPKIGE
jgi:predicted transcriptional regulator